MENEQRRSPRIMFSIPLTVRGVDENGEPFEATGRTITLNRHGARIQVLHSLTPGQIIRLINQVNHAEAEFRVVGPVPAPLDQAGEWGVECLRLEINIWDIRFRPSQEGGDAHVLLSCLRCRLLSLQSLSMVEVEILEKAGWLTKPCVRCRQSTAWGYPQRAFELEVKTYQAAVHSTDGGDPLLSTDRRRHGRKLVQLPVQIRDDDGETEVAQTENISPEGFCFVSPREYLAGQTVVVVFPFDGASNRSEIRARIVRTELGANGARCIYGVFEPTPR